MRTRVLVLHPFLAAVVLVVAESIAIDRWDAAVGFIAGAVVVSGIAATVGTAVRHAEGSKRDRWALVLGGALSTAAACGVGFVIAVALNLTFFCQWADRCLQ